MRRLLLTLLLLWPSQFMAGEDNTPGEAKRVASLAFKYVQRHQNDDGSYGEKGSPLIVSQTALVVHALAASSWSYREEDGPFMLKAVAFLRAAQNEEGSFGKSQAKAAETILAVRAFLALGKESDNERIDKGIAYAKEKVRALSELDRPQLAGLAEMTSDLLSGKADRAAWKRPTADTPLLFLALRSILKAEHATGTDRFKSEVIVSWGVVNPDLFVSLEPMQTALGELKASQQVKDDQADEYGAVLPEKDDKVNGNLVVSTALAGRVADLIRSNYKAVQRKLAAEKKPNP